ncbi:MAG: hypothetical protein RLZZ546_1494 [Bacteroidota bacterium]|jgi:hypothetical protein
MKIVKGVLTFNSDDDFIKYTYTKKSDINYYIYDKIKLAIDLDINQVMIFKINLGVSNMVIKLKESEWVKPLEKCLTTFEADEEYELCEECIKLITYIKEKLLV